MSDCLAALADAVAARVRRVGDVVGDDTWFPDQRWGPGMSWNNIGREDGTAVSALTLDDNVVQLAIAPGKAGEPPRAAPPAWLRLRNEARAIAEGEATIAVEQRINRREARLYGEIPASAPPFELTLGLDDPAERAAWALRDMLVARGVRVSGTVRARHRAVAVEDDKPRAAPLATPEPDWLARLTPPPLAEDVAITNKRSQNLHAELLLRRLGRLNGGGSLADGLAQVEAVLASAGVPRAGYDFSDGSGMSTYNRASPRATVALLRWAAGQSWGEAFRASLAVGGEDGTLRRRFAGTPLQGRIRAKSGSVNGASALSGYLTAASGQELVFSIYANDMPGGAGATPFIDAALQAVAAGS